jgi:hypothetical protein
VVAHREAGPALVVVDAMHAAMLPPRRAEPHNWVAMRHRGW